MKWKEECIRRWMKAICFYNWNKATCNYVGRYALCYMNACFRMLTWMLNLPITQQMFDHRQHMLKDLFNISFMKHLIHSFKDPALDHRQHMLKDLFNVSFMKPPIHSFLKGLHLIIDNVTATIRHPYVIKSGVGSYSTRIDNEYW